jgi:hypothetical protein
MCYIETRGIYTCIPGVPVLRHQVIYLYLSTWYACTETPGTIPLPEYRMPGLCETRCTWCTRTDPRGGPVELAPEYRSRRSGHRSGWPTVNTCNCFILMRKSLTILAQSYSKKWLIDLRNTKTPRRMLLYGETGGGKNSICLLVLVTLWSQDCNP